MKDLKIIFSSVFIVISFFIGYYFGNINNKIEVKKALDKQSYINLEIKKGTVNITKSNEKINIIVNGKEYNSGSINLK